MFAAKQDYRAAWDAAFESDPPIPLNLDIELASVCNLRCPFCFIPDPNFEKMIRENSEDGRPRARLMPTKMALDLINQAATLGVPALKFNWRGESTLHPEYSRIIQHAARWWTEIDSGKPVFVNGSVLAAYMRPTFHDLLINSNFDFKAHALDGVLAATKAMVSLDSCRPDTHAKMRVGANYANVVGNIYEVLKHGHPNVWLRRVVCDMNRHEDFAADCDVLFSDFVGKFKVSEHQVFDRNSAERHGVDEHLLAPDYGRTYCGYPSQRLVVTASGLVVPCCIALMENLIVGDVKKQTLKEIWEGEPLRKLRATLRANDITNAPEACKGCQSWMAYKHPNREMVQDKEVVRT